MGSELIEDPYGLRPIWDAIFEIYLEFARLCDKYGLRHYAAGGTALGAVRHGGFIPWDDDLDFIMPRPDYEKFLSVASTELPAYYKLVNWKNTPEFSYLFSKIQDCRKGVIEDVEKQSGRKLSSGLFVDIYPIDGYPHGVFRRFCIWLRDLMLCPLEKYHLHRRYELSYKGRLAWYVGSILSLLVPWMNDHDQFMKLHEKTLLSTSWDSSKEEVGDIGFRLNAISLPRLYKSILGSPQPHRFHSGVVMVPEHVERYLKNKFGDYTTLPPEDERRPSHQYSWHCPWWLGPTRREGDNEQGFSA